MTFHPDHLLGRDYTFARAARGLTVKSRVTISAFDPERGWKLTSKLMSPTWVPTTMLRKLFAEGVLSA